jgi:3-phenylpropionate/trans-cinnamate dioxygenase ferredoxin component
MTTEREQVADTSADASTHPLRDGSCREGMGTRHVVCRYDEIPSGQMRSFDLDGREVLVIHGPRDRFYAISNECTHGEAPLDMGELHVARCEIECGVHGGRFDFTTGEPTGKPADEALPVYRVDIDGTDVVVTV